MIYGEAFDDMEEGPETTGPIPTSKAIMDGIDPEEAGAWVEAEWNRQQESRSHLNQQAALTYKVLNRMDCDEAGHSTVPFEAAKVKSMQTQLNLEVLAGALMQLLTPPGTKWVEFPTERAALRPVMDALKDLFFKDLMAGQNHAAFDAIVSHLMYLACAYPGCAAIVSKDDYYCEEEEKMLKGYCIEPFAYSDFVIDYDAKQWRDSYLIVRYMMSRGQLMEMSEQEAPDEALEDMPGAIFDRASVIKALEAGSGGDNTQTPLDAVMKKHKPKNNSNNSQWFEVKQFLGKPIGFEGTKNQDENVVIFVVNGVAIGYAPNPNKRRNWVYLGRRPAMGCSYSDSMGYILALMECQYNYLGTLMSMGIHLSSIPNSTFDHDRKEDAIAYAQMAMVIPGKARSNLFKLEQFQYNPGAGKSRMEEIKVEMREFVGTSVRQIGGEPTGNATATESIGAQQGAQSRNNNDAIFFSGAILELVDIAFDMFVEELAEEARTVTIIGKDEMGNEIESQIPVTVELVKAVKARPALQRLGGNSTTLFELQKMQQVMAMGPPNPIPLAKAIAKKLGITEELADEAFTPPAPPPMAPGQIPGQAQQQPGAPTEAPQLPHPNEQKRALQLA